jgi:tRNA modification GTPase
MSHADSPADTYAALLTPSGAGAIACLALYGPKAWEVARASFRPRSSAGSPLPTLPKVGPLWLGMLGESTADEVVITVKRAEPVPLVEVHCHGGREVVRLLLELLESRGVRQCTWLEFAHWITANALHAALSAGLANAVTVRTAAILLDQQQGALAEALQNTLGHWKRPENEQAMKLLAQLHRFTDVGRHLITPWRVVVSGAPNVGKSSLVNALAGYERCIVTEIPGTTRDVVSTVIALDGWPVELADTAGLRQGGGGLEEEGMVLARSAATEADLCLWVLDASREPIWPEFSAERVHFVVNKIDLPAAWNLRTAAHAAQVSARTGEGLSDLCAAIVQRLVPETPEPGVAVPCTTAICDAVEEAWRLQGAGESERARERLRSAWVPADSGTNQE